LSVNAYRGGRPNPLRLDSGNHDSCLNSRSRLLDPGVAPTSQVVRPLPHLAAARPIRSLPLEGRPRRNRWVAQPTITWHQTSIAEAQQYQPYIVHDVVRRSDLAFASTRSEDRTKCRPPDSVCPNSRSASGPLDVHRVLACVLLRPASVYNTMTHHHLNDLGGHPDHRRHHACPTSDPFRRRRCAQAGRTSVLTMTANAHRSVQTLSPG
jgi:hypothetical protein